MHEDRSLVHVHDLVQMQSKCNLLTTIIQRQFRVNNAWTAQISPTFFRLWYLLILGLVHFNNV